MTISLTVIDKIKKGYFIDKLTKRRISTELNVSYCKVREVLKSFEEGSEVKEKKKYDSTGRSILDSQDLINIQNYIELHPTCTLNELILNARLPSIHKSTLCKFLKKNNVKTYVSMKKTELSDENKSQRIDFSNYFLNVLRLNANDFDRFIYTDETLVFSSNGRQLVKTIGRRNDPNLYNIQPKQIFKVNIYGFITANSFHIFRISLNFNQREFYDLMVEGGLLEFMQSITPRQAYFVQDNSPVHEFALETRTTIRQQVNSLGMIYVEQPPFSPDINPIENVWSLLKANVRKKLKTRIVQNENELWSLVVESKNEINQRTIQKIIRSMPRRLEQVMRSEGKMTKY